MQFLFVRHAQPEWVRDGLTLDNPGLTEIGRAQAEQVGAYFGGIEADQLLVSPLQRAQETAAPIAEALGLVPAVHDWLAEIANPGWQDVPSEEVERIFREARQRPVDEHWEGLEGGEAFHAFHRRVTHGLQAFLDDDGNTRVNERPAMWKLRDTDRRVVVVAHAGTNAAAIGYLLGIDPVPWEWERFVSFHASVSEVSPISIGGVNAYSLTRFADVAHLDLDLRTR